jgi:TRAP-type C4-dicarboxylate transport system substrate-binding protein
MINLRKSALAAAIGTALAAPAPALAQAALTFSSWVSPTHSLSVWQRGWAAEVEKATSGRVKFQELPKHPSAPPGTFDAVRDGLVDLSYVTASYTPARHVLPAMAELPGAGATSEINSVAYSRMHWKHFHKVGEYNGVKLLAVFTHGPGHMFNTKKPINSLADLKGMKIRTGGGIAEKFGNLLGASAFVKPAPESYELLNSGVADGTFFPLESIVTFKLDKVVKFATLFPGGFYSSSFGFFMNQGKWDKLAKQDQAIVEKLAGEAAARSNGRSWDAADKGGLELLQKSAVKIDTAPASLVKELMSFARQLDDEWIKAASAKGVDAAKILSEFREELKKVAAGR